MTHNYRRFLVIAVLMLAIPAPVRSHPSESPRIVAGKDAELGQFPYQAMLRIQMEKGRALCGGSLISEEWVLTAGHCVEGASSFEVHLGAVEFKEPEGGDGRTVLNSTEFIRHEEYRRESVSNDIAVIKLPQRVPFSDRIRPVALPTGHDDYNRRMAIASGWGKTKDRGGAAQRLQYAPLKVISNTECMLLYGPGTIQPSTICTRGENRQSTCNGDSGGPLVLEDDRTLIGVVSFGSAIGCERRLPVAFARVTEFTEWIRNKTGVAAGSGEGTTTESQ
ncbi:serine-type enodpeptidase [Culex quinquefasciatus]|uniref:Serine-type enodpeptidase n=1 Tax=Culex quinquefasciatus TaxID=7176 RepID=B0WD43_CULQU|nr:serine-type enodpeptidase [Culex quinquefasciatus]|eukprot:XP_001846627.1 serine-type enodpeptidase [Culex quinquefasciatus]